MKLFHSVMGWALLAIIVLSCQKEGTEGPVRQTIVATMEDNATKTILDPGAPTRVLWSAHEQVNLFVGNTSYLFTGGNEEAAPETTFTGTAPDPLGTYVLLSPYNAGASQTGTIITTTLAATQTAAAGGFAHGTAITAGQSSTSTVTCKHVCSGIRFKLAQNDITRITLSGRNGEKIAGAFSFSFDAGGSPIAEEGTVEQITLVPPGGQTCFATDTWYYLILLPTSFTKGITFTAESVSRGTGVRTIPGPVTFSRGLIKDMKSSTLDYSMNWYNDSPTATNTCYGPANTFCLRPGESLSVDVSPRRILDGWIRSDVSFTGAPEANSCATLWNTGSVTASISSQTLTINAGASKGSALVAIKKDDTVLWSFLVWVTDAAPAEIDLPSGAKMQAPLGDGLFFQWGRKDPLQVSAALGAPASGSRLEYSITHPDTFIYGGETYDWISNNATYYDNNLWGSASGTKTVWDPCPQGWKVPQWSAFSGLSIGDVRFVDLGYISGKYPDSELTFYSGLTYWTATPSGNYDSCAFVNNGGETSDYEGNKRSLAAPVRCIKE